MFAAHISLGDEGAVMMMKSWEKRKRERINRGLHNEEICWPPSMRRFIILQFAGRRSTKLDVKSPDVPSNRAGSKVYLATL